MLKCSVLFSAAENRTEHFNIQSHTYIQFKPSTWPHITQIFPMLFIFTNCNSRYSYCVSPGDCPYKANYFQLNKTCLFVGIISIEKTPTYADNSIYHYTAAVTILAWSGGKRSYFKILIGKPQWNRQYGRPWDSRENNL